MFQFGLKQRSLRPMKTSSRSTYQPALSPSAIACSISARRPSGTRSSASRRSSQSLRGARVVSAHAFFFGPPET